MLYVSEQYVSQSEDATADTQYAAGPGPSAVRAESPDFRNAKRPS